MFAIDRLISSAVEAISAHLHVIHRNPITFLNVLHQRTRRDDLTSKFMAGNKWELTENSSS